MFILLVQYTHSMYILEINSSLHPPPIILRTVFILSLIAEERMSLEIISPVDISTEANTSTLLLGVVCLLARALLAAG